MMSLAEDQTEVERNWCKFPKPSRLTPASGSSSTRRMNSNCSRNPVSFGTRLALLLSVAAAALLISRPAQATDTLEAGTSSLEGKLVDIVGDTANFDIAGTDSSLAIDTNELKSLTTEDPRLVVYGDDDSVSGTVVGIREGNLAVRTENQETVEVPLDEIVTLGGPADGAFDRWSRDNLRFWSASLDLSASTSQSTTDTTQILFGASARRKSDDSELNMGVSYRYGTQKADGEAKQTNLDEAIGILNLRYTVWDRLFVFGDMQATYNAIQRLSLRAQPNAGAGWDFIDTDNGRLSGKAGFGWVYESYFNDERNEYAALTLGLNGEWDLPLDSTLAASVEYLPALSDFANNYLLQARLTYTIPVISFLDFKIQVTDDYNNQPAEGTQPNSFYFNVGLSVTL